MGRGKKSGRGMPRGGRGRGGTQGRGIYTPSTPPPWQQGMTPDTPSTLPLTEAAHGLTLMEEARETSRHDHKTWDLNSLRSKPVAFISAGNAEPLKQLEAILQKETGYSTAAVLARAEQPLTKGQTTATENIDDINTPQAESVPEQEGIPQDDQISPDGSLGTIQAQFFFDVDRKTPAYHTPLQTVPTEERAPSRQSNSSDEVILFKGRDSRPNNQTDEQISMAHLRKEITLVETQIETHRERATKVAESKFEIGAPQKKRGRQRDQRPTKRKTCDDDALIADYIENMRENGEEDTLLQMLRNQQDIGGSDYIPSEESDADFRAEIEASRSGIGRKRDSPLKAEDGTNDHYESESELDDETLARLLAGHEFGQNPISLADMDSEESDSSDEPQRWVDDLDVMDWDRPSLQRRKGKAAQGRLRVEVSDSELEQTLQAAWKNDRFKKADRKRQREEMRALGQLGRNAKPEDLRVKYPQGISIDEVAEEMRAFLQGISETLALPPMDKHARKVIHDLANKFNIKSKSVGNGDNRRPTLHRTKRTQQYSAASFDQALNRITRRYFPRLDGRRGKGAPRTIGSGRGNMTAATVQDGEIVGAAAPELGVENRGRAMLEKMGWSQGTALGAIDNKGILQPVSQAMKRSRAGLG